MSARRWLRRTRIALYLVVAGIVLLGVLRFDLVTLPAEGCSPLRTFEPGDRLVIDRWFGELAPDDAVLFQEPDGELYLARVGTLPPSAPDGMHANVAVGALWLVTDVADCPSRDSRVLGPVDPAWVTGRIHLVLPW